MTLRELGLLLAFVGSLFLAGWVARVGRLALERSHAACNEVMTAVRSECQTECADAMDRDAQVNLACEGKLRALRLDYEQQRQCCTGATAPPS